MMKEDIEIGVLTRTDLLARSRSLEMIRMLRLEAPLLLGRYGNHEPLQWRIDDREPEKVLDHWEDPFLWFSRKPRIQGSIWKGSSDRHSSLRISLDSSHFRLQSVIAFVENLSLRFSADYGYLHCFSRKEEKENPEMVQILRVGPTTHHLRKGIPELTVLTMLGKPYIDLIGHKSIDSAPVHEVRHPGEGLVSLHLVENPLSLRTDFDGFHQVRERAKDHLGRTLFWGIHGEQASRVPEFGLAMNPKVDQSDAFWSRILDA